MVNGTEQHDVMEFETETGVKTIDFTAGRRAFIRSLGLGAAGAATLGVAGVVGTFPAEAADQDVAVLNFALNLEYLEAEFYLHAYTGSGLMTSDTNGGTGTLGTTNGGRKVNFSSPLVKAYAQEIAQEELTHVRFLRGALGSSKVNKPELNISSNGAFTTAARAAGLVGPMQFFDAYGSDLNFLLASYIFEDVGVTAYHGAAPLLTNKTYLSAAAGILGVEAYHAGIIRTSLFAMGGTAATATQKISTLRAQLDGTADANGQPANGAGKVIDVGVGTTSAPTLVPVDSNAIVQARSTSQVLNIVYGNTSAKPGLFFPKGMNGAIS